MSRIVVDEELRKKLHNFTKSLELWDEQRYVRGYITPMVDQPLYDQVQFSLSEEELQDRLKEEDGRPIEEILRDLDNKA
jgi:hypothetical protein